MPKYDTVIKRLQNDVKNLQNANKTLKIKLDSTSEYLNELDSTNESKSQNKSQPILTSSRYISKLSTEINDNKCSNLLLNSESRKKIKEIYETIYTCKMCNAKYDSYDGHCYSGHCYFFPTFYE